MVDSDSVVETEKPTVILVLEIDVSRIDEHQNKVIRNLFTLVEIVVEPTNGYRLTKIDLDENLVGSILATIASN